jgi:crotonobetainyl-CoA:carnitine CoA-transferase CaiB-like acyl-CoA transferase
LLNSTYPGLRVLDLSTNIAGPFAAMMLGDMGADVVKVERPPIGDDTRALPPRWGDEATVFIAVNRNKRSVLLDIKSAEGREALLKLVETADVVVESFPPGLAEKLQLTFEHFRTRNPRIVLCTISAFGDGPLGSKMPGYDALVQAVSGLMSFTGHPETPPVRLAPSVLDLTTGMWGAIGIMAALTRRAVSGEGEHVRPSLLDSAFTLMNHQVLGFLATGNPPEKLGSGAPSATPYRVFEASDGAFMLATASDPQFVRLCRTLGLGGLESDPRFSAMPERLKHREELDSMLEEIFAKESVAAWLDRLGSAGISVGRVNDVRDSLEMEVTKERNLFIDPKALGWTEGMPQLRLPVDPTGSGVRRQPPKLGEHSAEILREFGYDAAAIERLGKA